MNARDPRKPDRERDRLDAARAWFRAHRSDAVPDAGFAARVAARLERRPEDLLGPAALRLLPAALALTAALAVFAARTDPAIAPADDPATGVAVDIAEATATSDVADPTEDLLAWVLEASDDAASAEDPGRRGSP